MKKKVPNESLRESIALGMGAVVNSFCKPYGNCLEYSVSYHLDQDAEFICKK